MGLGSWGVVSEGGCGGWRRGGRVWERGEGVRQQPSPQRVQALGEESLALNRRLVVQSVAVELGNRGRADDDAGRVARLEDVEGQQEGGAEGGREAVVGRGEEG